MWAFRWPLIVRARVFLCAGLCLTLAWATAVNGDVGANDLLSARCRANCLAEYSTATHVAGTQAQASKRGTNFLEGCLKDTQCAACVRPCNYTNITTSLASCHRYCQAGEDSCVETCGFLKRSHTTKPGSCRAPEAATGFEAACIKSCTKDGDCSDHLKCCSNGQGCGFTCQQPEKLNEDIPKMPHFVKVTESRKGRAAIISWHGAKVSNDTDSVAPLTVIYVLQYRHILSPKPHWGLNTPWQSVTQTTRRNYLVRNIQAGHWYQFRVAAVVANGTNGFTDPQAAFRSSRELQPPTAPRNLTESGFTIHEGKIDLNISWLPPSKSDLPVIKYKVYWSQRLSAITPEMVSLYVHKQNVPGNRTWNVIKGLKSDTSYFIQVEAIARHGDFRMKSARLSALMTTYKIPSEEDSELPTSHTAKFNRRDLIKVFNITSEPPFYHNSELKCLILWEIDEEDKIDITKYMITWKPITCGFRGDEKTLADIEPTGATSHGRTFFTYGLQYGCRYLVEIRAVNVQGRPGPVAEATFSVPQCPDILVKGNLQPECPTLAEPLPPLKPRQLQHSIYVAGNNISVVIKWKIPHSDAPIEQFNVKWGVIGHVPHQNDRSHSRKKDLSEMDKKTVKTQNLPGDAHRVVLETLAPYSRYAVEVAATSKAGQSRSARLEFSTPALPTLRTIVHESEPRKHADQPRASDLPHGESHPSYNNRPVVISSSTTAAFSSSSTSHHLSHKSLTDSINLLVRVVVAVIVTLLSLLL